MKTKNHHLMQSEERKEKCPEHDPQNFQRKHKYIPPVLHVLKIEMENGIASGSAVVTPSNNSNQVDHTWEVGQDRSTTIEFGD